MQQRHTVTFGGKSAGLFYGTKTDSFTAQNRKRVLFSGCIRRVSIKHRWADSVFVCVLVANDPYGLSRRKLNREKQSLHFENGLCAWYHTCDQLKKPSCCFSHPSEAALYIMDRCGVRMCHSHDESPSFSFVLITRVPVWFILIRFLSSCSFVVVS